MQNNSLLVSVIMNCHNGSTYLHEAIDSVYSQTYNNWEIIFWDNASTDDSVNIVKNYDNKIKYFRCEKKIPLYHARNKAINECNGQIVTFLDCDDVWNNEKLSLQLELFKKGYKFIYGRYELMDENGVAINKKIHKLKFGKVTNNLLVKNFISIGTVMIDTHLLKKFMFNPRFNLIGDFDLWVRVSFEIEFNFVNTIVEKSRQHNGNLSSHLKNDWILEQRILYREYLKKYGLSKLLFILVFILRSEIKFVLDKILLVLRDYIKIFITIL